MSTEATLEKDSDEFESAEFAPGTLVRDRDAQGENPEDPAVVLNTPPVPADEWTVPRLGRTVAEDNPEYPAESPVVVVAFRDHLDERLPGWGDREGYWPLSTLNERGVRHYSFPAARLERVAVEEDPRPESKDERNAGLGGSADSQGDVEVESEPTPEPEPAVDVDGLAQRLEDAGCAVTRRDRGLRVSKLGEMYLIKSSGEIEGDGALRERLNEILEQFEEGAE